METPRARPHLWCPRALHTCQQAACQLRSTHTNGARACPGAQQLWDLWAARATAIEQTTLPPLGQPPTECEAGLVKLLLPNGKPQGRAALRRGLTRVLGKDAPLPIRHLLAAGLLAAALRPRTTKESVQAMWWLRYLRAWSYS